MTFLMDILSWMMDEFNHWPKPHLLLLATCDEISSRMIDIWMTNHLVSHSNYNIVNLQSHQKMVHGIANNILCVGDIIP